MAGNLARSGTQKAIPAKDAKEKVIGYIQDGLKVAEAMSLVGRTEATYLDWMKKDLTFKGQVQTVRAARTEEKQTGKAEVPDFPEFCDKYLRQPLNIHQLRIWDAVNGREPRDLHPSMNWYAGYADRVLVNVPPDHAKSTTFTVNYTVWRIHKNPDVRILIVTRAAPLAKRFLYEIKQKLTSPLYREMHLRFAPEGGWKDEDGSWTNDLIYVRGKNTGDVVQKDPTVQAMGLKGTIYGTRADVVILDDISDSTNARDTSFQQTLINRDIDSRLPSEQEGGGLFMVLGTRVAPMDIYRVLLDEKDGDDRRVWSYLRQPAVLDYGEGDSKTWTTLWPARWPGPSLSRRRREAGWNLIYQQLDIDDDMTFKAEAVQASVNMGRFPGRMTAEGINHRAGGMDGLYVACGLDPAASGNTAIIVAGLDRETGKRWVIDGWNKQGALATEILAKITELTHTYRPHEWVVEVNAFQKFLTQLPEVKDFLHSRGVKLTPHQTQKNKWDSDFGIETMGPLFDSCIKYNEEHRRWRPVDRKDMLMDLPSTRQNKWVNDLVQQLCAWQPQGMAQLQKTDLVMALWFTHIAFCTVLNRSAERQTHLKSPFLTPAGRKRQGVIDLAAMRRERMEAAG